MDKDFIVSLDSLEKKYCVTFFSLSCFIDDIEKRYLKSELKQEEAECFEIPEGVVVPDKEYVKSLLDNISVIKIDGWGIEKFKENLTKLLDKGDFEDNEEIIMGVHDNIKKYIYEQETQFSDQEWEKLEEYIENAGYIPVSVKAGDDIRNYKLYFDRPIPADGGIPYTIKHIQLKPYILKFYDGEQVRDDLKLCGKCTYFSSEKGDELKK